ncbi:TetR/AcrR family transcriptional regulator [Rhodococcus sp. 15-725-2-2b]|jgi:transcription-repair coupling factor (superfamily II helicase)|uniref:ScbR family autoregulator-binding transcription factor n=1 Tax=Rhodococcus ruber TaxID=1830 RepID=A0ABT4MEY5_9NOCA|nr:MULTISPECIES: ScbR family autoregulator-binding transcription factor [Rhodococcus]AJW40346.1 Transcription-repair coupling factor [Rhodococcus sp. B7740]MCZ4519531.1 ScbR family autoregulator-binding transcription factor [Rhodococcus ruber]MDV8024592.1 ScbR family autoregulator-binding transcription factor [Rhodococcus sp. IEGM 1330]OZC67130.1 TetR/AcrR family transcriptional regulator [Rhodococcus sp. 06-470-2]OZC72812.1 TetR/AcrR family transcriptional regulator [Rhodococcus sp. 06-469-3-
MVRQARAEITRDTVLAGAANVFLRLGYANASLSEIISQSQVTKGALYFHFGSKEELARAVIDEGNARLTTACSQFNDGRIPALEAAIGISYIVVDLSVSDPMVSAMLRLSHQIGDYRGTEGNVMAGWSESFDRLAAKAIAQGDIDPNSDSRTIGSLVLEILTGVHMVAVATSTTEELPSRMERLWYYLLPALVPANKLDYFREFAARRVIRFGP